MTDTSSQRSARVFWLALPLHCLGSVAGNTAGWFPPENAMDTTDPKNQPLFNNVRRTRGHEVLIAGALLFATYLGVATVLIDNYQRPDVAVASARV